MRCGRCGYAVPEWLWLGDDHPVIVEESPVRIFRTDHAEDNTMKIVAESKVSIRMCSDVNVPKANSDFVDIGPECFADKNEKVISWKGENFYRGCGKPVNRSADTTTHCVKPVNHPSKECEDYFGKTKGRIEIVNHDD